MIIFTCSNWQRRPALLIRLQTRKVNFISRICNILSDIQSSFACGGKGHYEEYSGHITAGKLRTTYKKFPFSYFLFVWLCRCHWWKRFRAPLTYQMLTCLKDSFTVDLVFKFRSTRNMIAFFFLCRFAQGNGVSCFRFPFSFLNDLKCCIFFFSVFGLLQIIFGFIVIFLYFWLHCQKWR